MFASSRVANLRGARIRSDLIHSVDRTDERHEVAVVNAQIFGNASLGSAEPVNVWRGHQVVADEDNERSVGSVCGAVQNEVGLKVHSRCPMVACRRARIVHEPVVAFTDASNGLTHPEWKLRGTTIVALPRLLSETAHSGPDIATVILRYRANAACGAASGKDGAARGSKSAGDWCSDSSVGHYLMMLCGWVRVIEASRVRTCEKRQTPVNIWSRVGQSEAGSHDSLTVLTTDIPCCRGEGHVMPERNAL